MPKPEKLRRRIMFALIAASLPAACSAGDDPAGAGGNTTAGGSAEEGSAVGKADADPFLYPASRSAGTPATYATDVPIDRVAEWYRDPARRGEMMFASTERLDDGYLILGTAGEEGRSFAVKLTPRPGGGTESRVLPYDPKVGLDRNLLK